MWQNVNNKTNLKETVGGTANWLRIMSTFVQALVFLMLNFWILVLVFSYTS